MTKKQKFLRAGYTMISRLGKRRKKIQRYRKAKGIDNKVRLKMKGHLKNVSIGFRNKKKNRGLVKGFKPVIIYNIEDLKNIKKQETGIVAKIGIKKKMKIADYALKNNIRLLNLNAKKFLEKIEKCLKEEQEKKIEREGKKKEREKKAEETEKAKIEEKTSKKEENKEIESGKIFKENSEKEKFEEEKK